MVVFLKYIFNYTTILLYLSLILWVPSICIAVLSQVVKTRLAFMTAMMSAREKDWLN